MANFIHVVIHEVDEQDTCLIRSCQSEDAASKWCEELCSRYPNAFIDVSDVAPDQHLKAHDAEWYNEMVRGKR